MQLITMAHLGEAQGIIEAFSLKKLSSHVFVGEEITCLLTGEGPFEAATLTAAELARGKYTGVINLGIAGSLSSELEVGSVYPVRSVYLAIDGKPQFKSFRCFEQGMDTVTSFERILRPEKARLLSGIAHLVDREAWGVAMATRNFNLPFSSYKLISDIAGTTGVCEIIMEEAYDWSMLLTHHLQKLLNITTEQDNDLKGFHFTFTTQHKFDQYVTKLAQRENKTREEILLSLPVEKLREEKLLPKERSRILLLELETRLDPMKRTLEKNLQDWKRPFESKGIKLQTDPTWEDPAVNINFTVNDQTELAQKLEALKELKLDDYHKIRMGQTYVE